MYLYQLWHASLYFDRPSDMTGCTVVELEGATAVPSADTNTIVYIV